MTVHCPHCSTDYLLPNHLLGSRGAKVRCPSCQQMFTVLRVAGSDEWRIEASPAPAPTADLSTPETSHPLSSFLGVGPDLVLPSIAAEAAAAVSGSAGGESADDDPAALASRFLDEMSHRLGDRLTDAVSRGRLLSELGPELMRAYDDFRRTLVKGADAAVFRTAVKQRWGVDLEPDRGVSAAEPPAPAERG